MTINDKEDEIIKQFFQLIFSRYQTGLKISTKTIDFMNKCVNLLQYKLLKKEIKRGGSYIDSPDRIGNKKTARNPIKKKDNKCFQCSLAIVVNYEKMEK